MVPQNDDVMRMRWRGAAAVTLVDMRRIEGRKHDDLQPRLGDALEQTLAREEQALLYLNRRDIDVCVLPRLRNRRAARLRHAADVS